jgi:hypothetical protein
LIEQRVKFSVQFLNQRKRWDAGARRRVAAGDIFHRAVFGFGYQDGGHDGGHRKRGVVPGVFAAVVLVVVLDQVFEQGGVEVVALFKQMLGAEPGQFVEHRAHEAVALVGAAGDVLAEAVEQRHLFVVVGLHREDVVVGHGDGDERVVEQLGEAGFAGAVEQAGDELVDSEARRFRRQPVLQRPPLAFGRFCQVAAAASFGSSCFISCANLSHSSL